MRDTQGSREIEKKKCRSEYMAWQSAVRRCTNPKDPAYKNYGGRGIRVCDRWRGREGFLNFLQDIGPKPGRNHQLDRIDNNGNYEPNNVRWTTRRVQANNKRNTVMITIKGITKSRSQWKRDGKRGLGPTIMSAYFPKEDADRVREAAKLLNMTPSSLMRMALLKGTEFEVKGTVETFKRLRQLRDG